MKLLNGAITCSLFCMLSGPLFALETAGKTMIAKGMVEAFEANTDKRRLKRRSPIFDVDTVTTNPNSKAQFRMNDGTLLAVKESSKLLISEYKYTPDVEGNSAVLELVEGGLRSVTGAIKSNNGSYQLKTPVGSIGIRGTHFEIELIDGDMFVAVWDGAIDLTVDTGTGTDTVSFGEGEDFSFGVVSEAGEVTQLLEAPENFDQGHSEEDGQDDDNSGDSDLENDDSDNAGDDGSQEEGNGSDSDNDQENTPNSGSDEDDDDNDLGNGDLGDDDNDLAGDDLSGGDNDDSDLPDDTNLDDEEDVTSELIEETVQENDLASPDIIASRTGQFTYSRLVDSSVSSSVGGAGQLEVSMTVDFDNGFVPDGTLSFTDNGGEWFAVFNGVIDVNEILLGVNFATHGEALADGSIDAFFANDGDRISGNFNLFEINNPNVTANGRFQIE